MMEEAAAPGSRPDQVAKLEAKWLEREADKLKRRELAAEVSDPTENTHVFWQSFNEAKRMAMDLVEEAEGAASARASEDPSRQDVDAAVHGGVKAEPAALLKEATRIVSGLQEQVARATIFLPPYDQRLSSDTVVSLHDAIGKARRRVCPKPSFVFKTRKSAPAPLAVLIAEVRREVGTTSDQDHLQGDTTAENLDPTLCFVDREGETLVKATGEVKGRDFVLARLKNCTVFIADTCGAVRADRLDNCRVFIGPTRSLLVEKADDTTIAVAAQQVRIHSATRCDFFVRMRSGPIIEHSSSLRFAPYHFSYPALAVQLRDFGLGEDNGLWRKVEDFNWLRARQSPNWCILEEEDRPPPVSAPGECAVVTTGADVDAGDGDEI